MKEEHLEVRRRHGPTVLEKLRWHLGSIVAVVIGIVLVLQVLGMIAPPSRPAKDALVELRDATARIKTGVDARAFPLDERIKGVDDQVTKLRTTFKHLPSPIEATAGITYPVEYLKTLKPGESNEIRFQAPIDVVATPEASGVDLKWAEAANSNVKVGGFELFRKEDGGEAVVIQKVDGSTHAFRDATAKPGHAYEYTVQAIAQDPAIANTPRGRSAHSAAAQTKAVADFKIELIDHKDDVATMKVSKWHEGAWRDRMFDVKEGQTIGALDQALGIDFSTGRQLSKLTLETAEVPVSKDELVFDAKGRVVIENGTPKRVSVSTVETKRKATASITGGTLPDEALVLEKT